MEQPNKFTNFFNNIPRPSIEVVTAANDVMAQIEKWKRLFIKLTEYTLIYMLSSFGFGYGWILFLISVWAFRDFQRLENIDVAVQGTEDVAKKVEKDQTNFDWYPSWVTFPDFDRVEWINNILEQLWPHIDPYSTYFMKNFIEPQIQKILDRMNLEKASGFNFKRVLLGTIPAKLGGVKVYKSIDTTKDEIILDCDVAYCGDARVQFRLTNFIFKYRTRLITVRGLY